MRVTFLLVAFLAGAHSFKAVERRAKPMGKGGGGVVARSVVEAEDTSVRRLITV